MLGRLGDLGAPQGAAPRRPDRRHRLHGAAPARRRCASARRTSTCWSGPTAIATCPRCCGGRREPCDPHVGLRLDRDETYADLPVARGPGVRAWVTVMRGCDRFCTFCIVPVRARPRAQPAGARRSLEQVRAAGRRRRVARSSSSARPSTRTATTAGTSRASCARPPPYRASHGIRFTSPHPADMTDAVDRRHGRVPRRDAAAPPAGAVGLRPRARAHGARLHRRPAYEALVERLRERVPGIALSTDVIVGFPGETDDDFAATEALLRRVRYDSAFLFRYSAREGTRAAKLARTTCPTTRRAAGSSV